MNKRLVILGASGHAKVILDLAQKIKRYDSYILLDDNPHGDILGYPVVGAIDEATDYLDGQTEYIIAIGNNQIRKRIALEQDLPWATLIHPSAQIADSVQISAGTVVMAEAVINADAIIGSHCIINTASVVEHDNRIGDYVHISPKAVLGGTVQVSAGTHIGIGAVVKNNINIEGDCTVGAGAVVVKHISESGTYVGIPARKIK